MRPALLLVAALLLVGCSGAATSTLLLLTDHSEMAAYAEVFNGSQRDLKVELVYRPDPAAALRKGDTGGADVVVAEGLAGRDMREHFRSIGDLLGKGRLDPRGFYPGLLEAGRQDKTQYLFPLSFNLPMVVYAPSALGEDAPATYLAPDYIRKKGEEFDARKSAIARKVGFSPLWRPEFVYYAAALTGAGFRSGDGRSAQWDESALDAAVTRFKDWVGSLNAEDLKDFDAKYLHIPFYRLIEDGRILFYLSDTREFLAVPPEKRQNLEFRWLGDKDKIPVADEILQAGALRRSHNPRGARRFLLWLFEPRTQIQLMETNHFKRLPGVFGVAGGIPALVSVAEKDLPQPHHYPVFVGHIPPRDMLLAPGLLPAGWHEVRQTVVLPWLRDAVAGAAAPPTLRKRLEAAGLR
jgi:ABC-type glycerol-3-phosphate transport system substrate-binding protein